MERKIELCLFDADDRSWRGLIRVDGEMFKCHLFCGSMTKPWSAVLMTGAFTNCTPGNPLTKAIEEGYQEYILRQSLTQDEYDALLKLAMERPEVIEELINHLKKEKDNGGVQEGESDIP